MRKVLFCFKMPHGGYRGGIASTIDSYLDNQKLFREEKIDAELFDYEQPDMCNKLPSQLSNALYGLVQRKNLLRKLKTCPPDVVHIHTSRQFLYLKDIWLAREIKKHRSIPVVVTVHVGAAKTVFHRIAFFRKQTIRWINRYVDKMIFLSDRIQKDFCEMGMKAEKGVVLGNFYDLAPLCEADTSGRQANLHLLFVGAIHKEKGILELMTALSCMTDIDFHLDICGTLTDPSIKAIFEGLVAQLGERVTLHGYVRGQKKATLYQRADALILPSYHEGFPLAILEALAGGCAIVATPVGAMPEVLAKKNVIWVEIGSVTGIQEAVTELADNSEKLLAMKQENKKLSAEYSVEKHIRKLCQIYQEQGRGCKQNETGHTSA